MPELGLWQKQILPVCEEAENRLSNTFLLLILKDTNLVVIHLSATQRWEYSIKDFAQKYTEIQLSFVHITPYAPLVTKQLTQHMYNNYTMRFHTDGKSDNRPVFL